MFGFNKKIKQITGRDGRRRRPRRAAKRARAYPWAEWSDQKLLDTRICDLGLTIEGGEIAPLIEQLSRELGQRGLVFRPHYWLSDSWFCPDGVPGFAIPFYFAHPRLKRLEKTHMLEVEGINKSACMRLMRHETAHALANAHRLHLRQAWRRRFGRASRTYPDSYLPRPGSKNYVLHLEGWYAQSHPAEDWAETFAVWLDPGTRWQQRYRDWPAIKKLNYVDSLMQEIGPRPAPVRTRKQIDAVSTLKLSLREYFNEKQARLRKDFPCFHEQQLHDLFSVKNSRNERASRFLRRTRREAIDLTARWTSDARYRIDQTLQDMIKRCDELDLYVPSKEKQMKLQLIAALVMLYMGSMRSGKSRLTV